MPENSRQQVKAEFKLAIVDAGRTIIREGLTVSTWGNIKILTDRGIELIIADQEDTNQRSEEPYP
jgi:hypothetical protein